MKLWNHHRQCLYQLHCSIIMITIVMHCLLSFQSTVASSDMDELVRDLHNDILNVTAVGDRDDCVRGGAIRDEYHTRAARRDNDRKKRTVSVDTQLGRIVGFDNDKYTNAFLGIPYAEPPVGNFRYRPPRPKESWAPNAVRATSFSPECLQSSLYSGEIRPNSEDCLYLNVWTPKSARYQSSARDKGELLPVMIWVYGGAFLHGGANKPEYEGAQLARRGVIIVSLNYRLGALGFLVSTVDGLYGNYGLADQKMAMMWVKQNIMSFGGDPNRVTVFGESAGAMSLGLHILDQHQRQQRQRRMKEPLSSLFQAAILQSNPFGYRFRSVAVANFLGIEFKERLDCEDLRCLQSESADELIHVQDTLMAVPRNIGDFFTWGPVVTDEHFWREFRLRPGPWANVTVRHPLSVIRQLSADVRGLKYDARQRFLEEGDCDDDDDEDDDRVESQVASNHRRYSNSNVEPLIPMVIGTTKDEGTVFVFTAYPTVMPRFMYQAMVFGFFRFDAPRVLKQYAALSREQQLSPHPDYRLVLSVIIGDYLFKCPTQLFATMATTANSSVYLFEFSLPTKVPDYPCCDGLSCHTSELPYVFNHLDIINDQYSWQDDNGDVSYDYDLLKMMMIEEEDSWGGGGGGGKGGSHGSTTNAGKRSWYEMAAQFFGGGKRAHGSDDVSEREDGGGENRPRRSANNDVRPARSAIDANISDIMANYWVNFASSHDPNVHGEGGEDDSDSSLSEHSSFNAVQRNGVPLWVTLNGFRRGWGIERGDRGVGMDGGGNFDDDFDGNDVDMDGDRTASRGESAEHRQHQRRVQQSYSHRSPHVRYGADLQRKIRLKSSTVSKIYNHQLVLDSITEMNIIGEDCNCRFWNDYQYKFQ
jgi:carboxylesterase type B